MESKFVTIIVEGVVVIGQITCRQKDFISVQMISPFLGWEKYCSITGQARAHCSYLTSLGDERARALLQDNYLKIKTIDHSIDRFVKVFDHLQSELRLINKLPKSKIRDGISYKVRWWFYSECLFAASVTQMVATWDEQKRIDEILKTYKKEGRKIYLKEDRPNEPQ